MKKLILGVALLIPSCATQQTRYEKIAEFKFITNDMCIDSKDEIVLAQHLYNNMVNK